MSKEVKIAPEFGAFPVWVVPSDDIIYQPLDANNTLISSQLFKELEDWDELYQQTLDQNYPSDSKFKSIEEELSFERKGIELWRKMKFELGTAYTISYQSKLLDSAYRNIDLLEEALSKIDINQNQ